MSTSSAVLEIQRSLRKLSAKKRAISLLMVFSVILAMGSVVIAFLRGQILIPIGPILLFGITAFARSSCVEEMLDLDDSLTREKA